MRKIDKVTYLEKPLYLKIDFDDDKNFRQLQGTTMELPFSQVIVEVERKYIDDRTLSDRRCSFCYAALAVNLSL